MDVTATCGLGLWVHVGGAALEEAAACAFLMAVSFNVCCT